MLWETPLRPGNSTWKQERKRREGKERDKLAFGGGDSSIRTEKKKKRKIDLSFQSRGDAGSSSVLTSLDAVPIHVAEWRTHL